MSILFLTFKSANRIGNVLLSVILFLFSLLLLEEFMEASKLYKVFPKLLMSTFTLDAAFGPLIYLYSISVCNRAEIQKQKWHMLPIVILSVVFLIFHFGTPQGAFSWIDPAPTRFFVTIVNIKILYLAAYFFLSIRVLRSCNNQREGSIPANNRSQIKALTLILRVTLVSIVIIYILFDLNILYPEALPPSDLFTAFLITVCIYGIVFIAIRFPFVFTEVKEQEFYERKILTEYASSSYKTSSLTASQKELYTHQLLTLMSEVKPYRNQLLKVEDIAQQINIPVHHLSQLINEVLEKNFYEFVNYYRVKEVKEKILDPRESHKSILGIALDAGFNSKATFNRAFKEFTGLTPSAYKARQIKK